MKDIAVVGGLMLFFMALFLGMLSEGSLLTAVIRASVVLLISTTFLFTVSVAIVKLRQSEQNQESVD